MSSSKSFKRSNTNINDQNLYNYGYHDCSPHIFSSNWATKCRWVVQDFTPSQILTIGLKSHKTYLKLKMFQVSFFF